MQMMEGYLLPGTAPPLLKILEPSSMDSMNRRPPQSCRKSACPEDISDQAFSTVLAWALWHNGVFNWSLGYHESSS
jgi:hypothetical protein